MDAERKLVLIVDDELNLLEVTSFVLESEGFGVETARNGKEALERLRTGKLPGLVLLDLMMPVMNGWEFLEEIAKVPTLREIPVVVLTAGGATGIAGAVEVLRKPFDLGVLVETVERHARGCE